MVILRGEMVFDYLVIASSLEKDRFNFETTEDHKSIVEQLRDAMQEWYRG